jgi:hypothetical protein
MLLGAGQVSALTAHNTAQPSITHNTQHKLHTSWQLATLPMELGEGMCYLLSSCLLGWLCVGDEFSSTTLKRRPGGRTGRTCHPTRGLTTSTQQAGMQAALCGLHLPAHAHAPSMALGGMYSTHRRGGSTKVQVIQSSLEGGTYPP